MHPSQARQAQSWDAVSPRPHGTDLLQGLASLAHSGGSHGWLCGGLAGTPAGFQPLSRGWGLGRWLSSWWGSPLRGARGSECGDLNGRNKGMVLMTVVSSLFPPSVDPGPAPGTHGLTWVEGWWPLSAPVPTQCGPWSSTRDSRAHRGGGVVAVVSSLFPPSVDPDPAPRIHGLTGLEVGDTPVGTPLSGGCR